MSATYAQSMLSLVPTIVFLGLAAIVAAGLALRRPSSVRPAAECAAASRALAVATAMQSAHFLEEWATGFNSRFPALFGLDPMPLVFFISFNLAWIIAWIASLPLLRSARTPAFFTAWFLAIAGMLNGLAHPAMAAISGGYFPGLITSPLTALAGIVLWQRLYRASFGGAA